MNPEQRRQSLPLSLKDVFGFTEGEWRDYTVSHKRLLALIEDERTTVHNIDLDYNNYGEFLFVTLSRPGGEKRRLVTFYGAGFHEHRECWITERWNWYEAHSTPDRLAQTMTRREALRLIEERRVEVARYAKDAPEPSPHAALFALIADLTDEDGALAELEDLGPWVEQLIEDEDD